MNRHAGTIGENRARPEHIPAGAASAANAFCALRRDLPVSLFGGVRVGRQLVENRVLVPEPTGVPAVEAANFAAGVCATLELIAVPATQKSPQILRRVDADRRMLPWPEIAVPVEIEPVRADEEGLFEVRHREPFDDLGKGDFIEV